MPVSRTKSTYALITVLCVLVGCQTRLPEIDETEQSQIASSRASCDFDQLGASGRLDAPLVPEGALTKLGWGQVLGMSLSPDGGCAAVLTTQAVIIYDVGNLNKIVFALHRTSSGQIVWSPNRDWIAVRDGENITVWDALAGEKISSYFAGERYHLSQLAWSPDSTMLMTISGDEVRVFQSQTGELVTNYSVEYPDAVAWSPDGKQVAIGSNSEVKLYSLDSNAPTSIYTISDYSNPVTALTFHPNGQSLAIAFGYEATDVYGGSGVQVIDIASGKEIYLIENSSNGPYSAAWSPDGTRLVTGWSDGSVLISDAETGGDFGKAAQHEDGFGFGQDGVIDAEWASKDRVVSISSNGRLSVYALSTQSVEVSTFVSTHTWDIEGFDWSNDGSRFATVGFDGQVLIWDANTQEVIQRISHPTMTIGYSLAFSPDDKFLAVLVGQVVHPGFMPYLLVFDLNTGEWLQQLNTDQQAIDGMGWLPNENQLYFWSNWDQGSSAIYRWSPDSAQAEKVQLTVQGFVGNIAEDADGRIHLATTTQNGNVGLFSIDDPDHSLWIEAGSGWNIQVLFSPDGSQLAVLNEDEAVTLWDIETGELITTIQGYAWPTPGIISYSPDSQIIVTSMNETLAIWDTTSGEQLGVVPEIATATAFSSNGRFLAVGHADGTITVWDVARLVR